MSTKYRFEKVFDRSNRRIRGLWQRNGSFYCQTTVSDSTTGVKKVVKQRLDAARTVPEATKAMFDLLNRIEEGNVPINGAGPTFAVFREHYKKVNLKAPKTVKNEDHFLSKWEEFLGPEIKIGHITTRNVVAYRASLVGNVSPRTINLHTIALKSMMKLAIHEGYIKKLPLDGVVEVKEKQIEKRLLTEEDITNLGTAALQYHHRNGVQFVNVLMLLVYSGGRISETLALKWDDIDWDNQQLVFRGENTKNSQTRRVDFNQNLKNHLMCMKATKSGDYLFPSCRAKGAVTTLKKILLDVKVDAEVLDFHWHLCRHYFISQCVMKGIDYLTIARWVGHKDGGVLIGRIYGHLNSDHAKEQAKKLTF